MEVGTEYRTRRALLRNLVTSLIVEGAHRDHPYQASHASSREKMITLGKRAMWPPAVGGGLSDDADASISCSTTFSPRYATATAGYPAHRSCGFARRRRRHRFVELLGSRKDAGRKAPESGPNFRTKRAEGKPQSHESAEAEKQAGGGNGSGNPKRSNALFDAGQNASVLRVRFCLAPWSGLEGPTSIFATNAEPPILVPTCNRGISGISLITDLRPKTIGSCLRRVHGQVAQSSYPRKKRSMRRAHGYKLRASH